MLTKKGAPKSPTKGTKTSKPAATKAANATVEVLLKSSLNQPPSPTKNLPKTASAVAKKKRPSTKITIKYNAGFPNQLFIRGEGADLSWEKGQALVNVKADEWVWETTKSFSQCQFKILLNDQVYEKGENHLLQEGAVIQYTPCFP